MLQFILYLVKVKRKPYADYLYFNLSYSLVLSKTKLTQKIALNALFVVTTVW